MDGNNRQFNQQINPQPQYGQYTQQGQPQPQYGQYTQQGQPQPQYGQYTQQGQPQGQPQYYQQAPGPLPSTQPQPRIKPKNVQIIRVFARLFEGFDGTVTG